VALRKKTDTQFMVTYNSIVCE